VAWVTTPGTTVRTRPATAAMVSPSATAPSDEVSASPPTAPEVGTATPELRPSAGPRVLTWVASIGEWSAHVGVTVASGVAYVPSAIGATIQRAQSSSALEGDLHSRVRHEGEPLDMDVIDTSWMDSNVHALRHNYFNVNRWMLDDIRDIITTKRRASMRSGGLTHRRGNVWSFVGAPKYIVNP